MKQSLKSFYTGDKGHDGTTLGWNAIMGLVLYLSQLMFRYLEIDLTTVSL